MISQFIVKFHLFSLFRILDFIIRVIPHSLPYHHFFFSHSSLFSLPSFFFESFLTFFPTFHALVRMLLYSLSHYGFFYKNLSQSIQFLSSVVQRNGLLRFIFSIIDFFFLCGWYPLLLYSLHCYI